MFNEIGDNIIAQLGETEGAGPDADGMGPDGTAGNQPTGTVIKSNFAYRCGLFEKQSSFYFQVKGGGRWKQKRPNHVFSRSRFRSISLSLSIARGYFLSFSLFLSLSLSFSLSLSLFPSLSLSFPLFGRGFLRSGGVRRGTISDIGGLAPDLKSALHTPQAHLLAVLLCGLGGLAADADTMSVRCPSPDL